MVYFLAALTRGAIKGVKLESRKIVIGRSSGSDIVVEDPHVSRRHCELVHHALKGWCIKDLKSENGTTIMRKGMEHYIQNLPENEFPLKKGDRILLGDVALEFME